jgi:DNA-binding transcriptional LysR family regulator
MYKQDDHMDGRSGMLDANQANVFLTAAETLSFTQAARRLHMTQPSVSEHIRRLEQHYGTPLFMRSGRRLELTDAGATLLPLARQVVGLAVPVEETMDSLKGTMHGHLIVGCSTTPGKYLLPRLLASFMRLHPHVRATCQVASASVSLQHLTDGLVHVALASAREAGRDLEFRPFVTDPVVLITPLDHPWARRGWVIPDELLDEAFILREEGSGTRAAVREGLPEVGLSLQDLRVVLTLGNSEAIAMAVEEGIGIGFVSNMVAGRMFPGRVAVVRVEGLALAQEICLARHARRAATAVVAAFWDFANDPRQQAGAARGAGVPADDVLPAALAGAALPL